MEFKRYKIIAEYPDQEGPIGHIIENAQVIQNPGFYEKYPHLFKELEWWEYTTFAAAPQYLKNKKTHEVSVFQYFAGCYNYVVLKRLEVITRASMSDLIPSTKEEYEDQFKPTTEQLLLPRYKLVGNYPGNTKTLGYIYSIAGDEETIKKWTEEKDQYPRVFKRLEWWEDRPENELPRYISFPSGRIFKFIRRLKDDGYSELQKPDGEEYYSSLRNMQPATLQDYLNQPFLKEN